MAASDSKVEFLSQSNDDWSSSPTVRSIANSVGAGYCAGVAGVLVGHPLDSIKVWMQTVTKNPTSLANQAATQSATTRVDSAISDGGSATTTRLLGNVRTKSSSLAKYRFPRLTPSLSLLFPQQHRAALRRLYAGMSGPLVTNGLVQSINFGVYDTCRRILRSNQSGSATTNTHYHPNDSYEQLPCSHNDIDEDSLLHVGLSSMMGAAVISVLTNPLALIKTRQQVFAATSTTSTHESSQGLSSLKPKVLGFREAVIQIYRNHDGVATNCTNRGSIRHFYRGYVPHFFFEVIGRGNYLVVYEFMKRQLIKLRKDGISSESTAKDTTFLTALSLPSLPLSSMSTTSIKPSVSTVMTNDETLHHHHKNTLLERMLAAGIAGMVSWTIIYPFDTIRCRLYASSSTALKRPVLSIGNDPSTLSTTKDTVFGTNYGKLLLRQLGGDVGGGGLTQLRSLYRGYGIVMVRAGPVAAFVLPMYDVSLEFISSL